MGSSQSEHSLTRFAEGSEVGDELRKQEQIYQIAEPVVLPTFGGRKRHSVDLLGSLNVQRKARKALRESEAELPKIECLDHLEVG